ncbi:GumC family protein [Caldinitratiruptor microaerophilus]|nr:Wzz/FepE/Etk N-terminal domain-containing protein [Caldinitratiruptor microaerophilus]
MEDEIDLRHLIEVLWQGKWLIAAITAVAMLVSGVVSFFVLAPTYEATTTLLVNLPSRSAPPTFLVNLPPGEWPPSGQGVQSVLERLAPYPEMTLETFRQQVTNSAVLARVIDDLKLNMTKADLAGKIKATVPKDTNLIQIAVRDTDPERAARIANTLVQRYLEHVNVLTRGRFERSTEFIRDQIEAEQQNLQQALDRLKAFLQQPRGVDELSKEVEAKVDLLARYKARQTDLAVGIRAAAAEVDQARAQVAALVPKLTTTRRIVDDPYLQQLAAELGRTDIARLSGLKLDSEEINPAWVEAAKVLSAKEVALAQLRAEQAALQEAIARTEKELETLRAELAEKQTAQEQLQTQVDISKQAIKAFTQKYQESRISEAARIAETTLTVAGEAIPPRRPVAPRKALNVALAGVLGAMAGVFTVFFLDFWRSTPPAATAGAAGVAAARGAGARTASELHSD